MPQQPLKIYIIAGEASGDIYGAKLIDNLQKISKRPIEFHGIGGAEMTKAGLHSLFPMQEISIMGFLEILPHIPNVMNRIRQTVNEIRNLQPDAVITIDSPGFCCRIAAKIQDVHTKLIHYVAPTVWAYKPERAEKFANLFDHLLLLLPFEAPYFDEVGLANTFVGHPITEIEIAKDAGEKFRKKYNIDKDDKLLCVLPGSRSTEIAKLLPIFIDTIDILLEEIPDLKVVIPTVPGTYQAIMDSSDDLPEDVIILEDAAEKYAAYAASDAALAKSGTGTIELAIAGCPMVIAYKINTLSYWFIKMLVKVKYANLINIISGREIIPELLQNNCTAEKLSAKLLEILQDKKIHDMQVKESQEILKQLGSGEKTTASAKAAKIILDIVDNS